MRKLVIGAAVSVMLAVPATAAAAPNAKGQ